MSDIRISIPTGEAQHIASGTTVAEAIKLLCSSKVRKSAVAAKVNGTLVDLAETLVGDAELEPIALESPEGLTVLRHSAAHVMAQAVLDLFGPEVQVTIGPAVEDGFYYDFDRSDSFSPDDFAKIEARMQEIVDANQPFVRQKVSKDEAIKLFQGKGQKYKVEIIEGIEAETVSLYQQGGFVDLCRGPHLPSTGWLKAFTIIKVAGAYWRGDEKNAMLQRLYGTAFADPKALSKLPVVHP